MPRWNRLAWKLSAGVLVIVTVVILVTGRYGSLLSQRYALDAARDVMHANSASIGSGIEELMLSNNCRGVPGFVEEMATHQAIYRSVRLVAHPSGWIAAPATAGAGTRLGGDDRPCIVCHALDAPPTSRPEVRDHLTSTRRDGRVLEVVTPIVNAPGCSTAACHAHAGQGLVLGILTAEYPLTGFDSLMTHLNLGLALAALLAILLLSGALLVMFRWLLARPLRNLVTGIETLADSDFGFRFPATRDDEIGLVEESFNDLADQVQAHQRELRRARDYMESIVEHSADLIITVNTSGRIQTFNLGAENALGYRRDEVIGEPVEMLFDNPRERDVAIARLREQDSVTNWETRFRTKDGRICHVLITLSRLRNRSGDLIGTLGISKDITIEKDLQRKLIRSESEAAIGRAVTAIQHAVKNMLNTLRGGLYIVRVGRKKDQTERIDEGCEMIEEGLARISDLSLNMLKYAREWKIEPAPVDLLAMVRQVVVAISEAARERGVSVRTVLADGMPDVPCDARLIHMGLMDIVSNALDACEAKDYEAGTVPEIVIQVSRDGERGDAVIEIRDNGIGMTQEVVANVFTPFFSTKKTWGTGLGLALTHRVIGLHDGEIEVTSSIGEGSMFRITLPLSGPKQTGGGR